MDGLFAGGGKVPAGGVLEVAVAGRNGVPVDAKAVALNVTVAEPEAAGYVTVWACGAPQPNASALNYAAGQTVANAAFAQFGDDGKVCFYTDQATHLIVDVNGAFPATSSFNPAPPARFADTRAGAATVDGMFAGAGKVEAGGVLRVGVGGRHGVPGDAEAVAVNVTVAEPAAAGYVTMWACGDPRPNASNLNYAAGQTVANAGFAELGADGDICVFSEQATHLIVDVNGVFPAESVFTPWWPARLADTRSGGATVDGQFAGDGKIPAGGVLTLPVAGRDGVPADADAVALNVTVAEPAAAGYVTVWPCGFARPNASNLNYAAGQTVANAVFAQFGDAGDVCFYSEQATQLIVDLNGVFGDAQPPAAPAPAVTSIAPTSGPASGGTAVTITGTDLTDATAVSFGSSPATFTVDSPTQITATAPAGVGIVDVTVTAPGGTATATGAYTYIAAPTITSIAPATGPATGGTTVTITGTDLTDATAVSFGSSPATFTVDSPTQITALTPPGVGTVDVAVTTTGGTATLSNGYSYVPAPTIISILPDAGPETGGTSVTITGADLTDASAVTFGGTPATSVVVVSPTQITATTPAGVGTVDVTVTAPGGTATATGAYTYIAAPTITSIAPSTGPATGGTTVTITGTDLTDATAVSFGSSPATFTVDSPTQITALTPPGVGTVDVAVTTTGGTATLSNGYSYVPAPTIISILPDAGPETGGTSVTITGADLTDASAVTFGGTPATSVVVVSPTQITATTPAGVGTVDVTVTAPGGTATATGAYTYIAAPTITSIAPSTGPATGGTTVTITGTGFTGTTAVSFAGNPALSFTVNSATQITAVTPAGTGLVDVAVTTPGGTDSDDGGYAYVPAPGIASITPAGGAEMGGTTVTITGINLTDATAVSFGSSPATFTVDSPTQITALTPPGVGTVDVAVTTTGGTATLSNGYSYVPAPTIISILPDAGPETGGTSVTITGSGFTATLAVSFDSTPAPFVLVSDTQLTAIAPAGVGAVDVVVTTTGGSATAVDAYTYVPAPGIFGLSPTTGPQAGGTLVTITGEGFSAATDVTFGGLPAASFTVDSPTQITAVTPAGTGAVDIVVSSPGGSSTAVSAYTYVPAPTIAAISPDTGPEAGGNTITITGTNLATTANVTFGATPAASFTVVTPTQITAIAPPGVGAVDVVVTTAGGSATDVSAYTYVPVPGIFGLSPTTGPQAGGTLVTITGEGFSAATDVTFGGLPAASFTVDSPTQITAVTPAGTGAVDIVVSSPGGSSTAVDAYTYVPAPTITNISPSTGVDLGGDTVTITGTGFTTTESVNIGGAAASFTLISDTEIMATTPPGPPGPADVTVTTAGGSATVVAGFTYIFGP